MDPIPRPTSARGRWTSFVAEPAESERPVRALHEQGNPAHRVRVEHDGHALLIHLSGEDGDGWTCIAVDRATREYRVAQDETQRGAAEAASRALYRS